MPVRLFGKILDAQRRKNVTSRQGEQVAAAVEERQGHRGSGRAGAEQGCVRGARGQG